ncbi:MAG TPA: hypothetical protein PLN93_00470 [Vicinamibacterales bacterium]|nr:hypothetical protein [Vicinamibacterales bacterium]HOQ60400.1 hypothetical protein [Vicinamibacterales bacterium]HPK70387.1 hypothetical protein [Vicinamibacterales bacterium]
MPMPLLTRFSRGPAWTTAAFAAFLAAAAGALAVVAAFQRHGSIRVDASRGIPAFVTGLYPTERQGKDYFAWSGGRVSVRAGLADRRAAWQCQARLVNWRPPSAGPADVRVEADGRVLLERRVSEPRASLDFAVPPVPARRDLDFEIVVSPTFVPGPQDPRELGLAFEGLRCDPAAGAWAWPARQVVARASLSAALAGLVLGIAGLPAGAAAGFAVLVAAAQGFSLASGAAAHLPGRPPVFLLAGLLAVFCLLPILAARFVRPQGLSTAARLAVAVSACACCLKLVFLLHPDKTLVDAVFHAHRFEMVLAGRFFFTQLSTSATPFPYAIGLYVFAAPWAALTADHVTLLRTVVCACEAAAVLLLYPLVARAWGDRAAGVAAVALYHLAPLPIAVLGNANLTNHFGQSVAVAAMAAAAGWSFAGRRAAETVGLALVAGLAFLSHVGTFAVLLPTLLVLALATRGLGRDAGRIPARCILAATALAVALAVGLYWGRFFDVYEPHIASAKAELASAFKRGSSAAAPAAHDAGGVPAARTTPLQLGFSGAVRQTRGAFGLPLIALAVAGASSLARRRRADRLVAALAAWFAAWAGFLLWSALRRVEPPYVQDAWEFIGRVEMATTPAVAILAACGAAWAWRSGRLLRAVSAGLVLAALAGGARAVVSWILF